MSHGLLLPTATTWVSRNAHGQLSAIAVADMSDAHIWRWIRFFRKKFRDNGIGGRDAVVDAAIKESMVTAPAIYAEADRRGLMELLQVRPGHIVETPDPPPPQVKSQPVAAHGSRRITLDEEE